MYIYNGHILFHFCTPYKKYSVIIKIDFFHISAACLET